MGRLFRSTGEIIASRTWKTIKYLSVAAAITALLYTRVDSQEINPEVEANVGTLTSHLVRNHDDIENVYGQDGSVVSTSYLKAFYVDGKTTLQAVYTHRPEGADSLSTAKTIAGITNIYFDKQPWGDADKANVNMGHDPKMFDLQQYHKKLESNVAKFEPEKNEALREEWHDKVQGPYEVLVKQMASNL